MPAENLAVCFAPNLLRCHGIPTDPQEVVICTQIIQYFIESPANLPPPTPEGETWQL
jgi:hypothetical protein